MCIPIYCRYFCAAKGCATFIGPQHPLEPNYCVKYYETGKQCPAHEWSKFRLEGEKKHDTKKCDECKEKERSRGTA